MKYYDLITKAGINCSKFNSRDGVIMQIGNVHVTTFKSSKGMEFDSVVMPNFEEMRNNIANLDVIDEGDYYVAFTRTRRNLFLISSIDLPLINPTTIQKEFL